MKRVILAAVAIATLALTGCVPSPNDPYAESAREALASLDGLAGDERRDAVMAIAAAAEADARSTLGVDDALGGTAAADVVFAGLRAPLAELVANDGPRVRFATISAQAAGSGAIATFLGLAFTMIGSMGDNAMDLADRGSVGSETAAMPGGEAQIAIGADGSVRSSFSTTMTQDSASAALTSAADVSACPAADGTLELTGSSDVRISVGTTSLSISLEVVATGRLDDTATLVESDYSYRHQTSSTADGKGEFFDHSSTANTAEVTVNRTSSGATTEFAQSAVDSAAVLAQMVANDLLEVAKRGWESGRCVSLAVSPSDGPGGLEPGTEVTIEATPTSTVDAKPTGGTIVATLSGDGSVDPEGTKLDAAATYTYTAPDEEDLSGTITFESRSNRGVGIATLTLTTGGQAYAAEGSEGEFTGSGTICSLTAQFTITGDGLTFTFTPTDEHGGSFRVTGSHDGVTFIGDGSYTVQHGETLATSITVDGDIVLTTPEGVAATSPTDLVLALRPIEPCG